MESQPSGGAADREWHYPALLYLKALAELAGTIHAKITETIHTIAPLRVSQLARTSGTVQGEEPGHGAGHEGKAKGETEGLL